jgi:hypothetical protein
MVLESQFCKLVKSSTKERGEKKEVRSLKIDDYKYFVIWGYKVVMTIWIEIFFYI